MNPSLYDLLDVEPTASDAEIRTAWKSAIGDLDPTDRRFRAYNQAAEVLLDPQRRAAYDAELVALTELEDEDTPEPRPEPAPGPAVAGGPDVSAEAPVAPAAGSLRRPVPGWLLVALGVLALALVAAAAYFSTRPSDTAIEDATREAQNAAERAVVPILSYDYRRLDEDQAAARPLLTDDYRDDYDQLFELIKQNAPETETVVSVEVVASGVVRSGTDRAEYLLFVDRPTTNAQNKEPIVYTDQVRVQMERQGDEWLVDCLITTRNGRCD